MRTATVTILGNPGKYVPVPFSAQFAMTSINQIIGYMQQLADNEKISHYYISINGESVFTV